MLRKPIAVVLVSIGLSLGAGSALAVVIDNGIAPGTVGHWSVDVWTGGESRSASLTANRFSSGDVFTEQVLYDYFTYISIGDGDANNFRLGDSSSAVLDGSGNAVSSGSFAGSLGNTINWSASSTIPAGASVMTTTYTFAVEQGTLGLLHLFQYMDEDIEGVSNDVYFTRGSVATSDLQLFTVDNVEVYGVSHSGAFGTLQGLANASYLGCAADRFDSMRPRLETGTQTLGSPDCVVQNLLAFTHPQVGAARGPADIVSVLAWQVSSDATSATIVTTLGGVADFRDIPTIPEPATLALLAIGLAGVGATQRKKVAA